MSPGRHPEPAVAIGSPVAVVTATALSRLMVDTFLKIQA